MRALFVAAVALALASCSQIAQDVDAGLGDLQKATANHAVAVTLLRSPQLQLPDDAGTSPEITGLSVFFGTLTNGGTSVAPAGIPGAQVTATDTAGMDAHCLDVGNGAYVATSLDGGVSYAPGATYTFTVSQAGTTYVATGSAPQPESVPAFASSAATVDGVPVFAQLSAGTGYTLTRQSSGGSQLAVAFVAVNALTSGGASANPTWTNLPQTPLALLQFAVDDSQWRSQTVAIPGKAFPSAGLYAVSLTAVNEGSPQSNDLFLASPVLIGAASAGILQAQ